MQDRMLVPLIVASALFMQNLDSTVVATALPAIAAGFRRQPHPPQAGAHHLSPDHRRVPAGLGLDGRPLRRAAGLPRGDRRLHRRLGAVRAFAVDRDAGLRAHRAGHRRLDDGAGRPAGRPAHGREIGAGGGALLADRAGADRPDPRAAGRRLPHHLCRAGRGSSGSTCRSASSASCWRPATCPTCAAKAESASTPAASS